MNDSKEIVSEKSWIVTLVFCIFLGLIGFHRFYVGKGGTAILMLLTLGGFGIWTVVDLITIIIDSFTDDDGKIIKRRIVITEA
ncbi:MAG: TM2 domain-containing protein [Clostridium sp.]|nr:TM2 domain-containing protein [Clostridium sp.]